jgi:hypothetical protein
LVLSAQPALAADADAVAATIAQAQQKQQQARDRQYAWSVTNDYIAEARRLLDAGDVDAAAAVAQRALKTASASLEQSAAEANAWPARVPGS